MTIVFSGEVWFWKGPSPFYFVTVPAEQSSELKQVQPLVSYGWGMIPVLARIGETEWTTSLWPKNGSFILPLKDRVRKAEGIEEGAMVGAQLEVALAHMPR